jgi:hypothetical protein
MPSPHIKEGLLLFNTLTSLREKISLPCNYLHGKGPYMHGKDRTVKQSTAKASLPCASPMLHGKGLCRATPHGKGCFFAVC